MTNLPSFWPDLLVVGLVLVYAVVAMRRGFVAGLFSLLGLVAAFAVAFTFYSGLATALSERLGWSLVWTRPAAFILLWLVTEMLVSLPGRWLSSRVRYSPGAMQTNRVLGLIPGALQGLLFAAMMLTVLAVLPMQGQARREIVQSPIGGKLVSATLALERPLEGVFGAAARETLGFITVPPTEPGTEHGESVKLNFTVDDPTTDEQDEES